MAMTHLLKKAVEQVEGLPDDQQDATASLILDELEYEERRETSFALRTSFLSGWPVKLSGSIRKEIPNRWTPRNCDLANDPTVSQTLQVPPTGDEATGATRLHPL